MRHTTSTFTAAALALLALGTGPLHAQSARERADREAVHRAVLDYVEGFYEGDTTKFVRSVAPNVFKYGYAMRGDAYVGSQMPYSGFISFARGVQQGRNRPPANAPKEITLFDVQDQTASAKLTAWWGVDYLLLAKQSGQWQVTQVMWQTPPPSH